MKHYAFWLVGICVVIFVLQLAIPGFTDALILDQSKSIEVWRFVSSIFLHGSVSHLLYNMFALALFGSMLEQIIGSRRFLLVFLATGIVANIIAEFFYPSSLGASGAIFGVIGALIMIRPGLTVFAFGMPMPIFVAGILWVGGDLLGAAAYVSGTPLGNTGNVAHLAGIAVGLLFGALYKERQYEPKRTRIVFDEHAVRKWEDEYL